MLWYDVRGDALLSQGADADRPDGCDDYSVSHRIFQSVLEADLVGDLKEVAHL